MNESKETANSKLKTSSEGVERSIRARRNAIYASIVVAAFLLGLVPMWLTASERGKDLDKAQADLRVSRLQNLLANAAVDARRGEYEPARQSVSEFYTRLREEIELGTTSAFSEAQREPLRSLLDNRDDSVTLLARSDAASGERLAEAYIVFRHSISNNISIRP